MLTSTHTEKEGGGHMKFIRLAIVLVPAMLILWSVGYTAIAG